MRKMILLVLIFPVVVFALGYATGSSPQSETATLTFIVPTHVGIYVQNDAQWNFGNVTINPSNPIYPPTSYPEEYYPTSPTSSPYQHLEYLVAGSPSGGVDWAVTVSGDGNPGSGILLSDIEHSPAGMGSWDAFNTAASPDTLVSGSGNTNGWQTFNQDYRVTLDGDEQQTGGVSCILTYTIRTD